MSQFSRSGLHLSIAESGGNYLFPPGKGVAEISNDLVHGMSKEILSLQSLAGKLEKHSIDNDAKFAEQKSVIDTLHIVWRTVIITAIVAAMAALFSIVVAFGLPSVYALGQRFADTWVLKAFPIIARPPISSGEQIPKQNVHPGAAEPSDSPTPPPSTHSRMLRGGRVFGTDPIRPMACASSAH